MAMASKRGVRPPRCGPAPPGGLRRRSSPVRPKMSGAAAYSILGIGTKVKSLTPRCGHAVVIKSAASSPHIFQGAPGRLRSATAYRTYRPPREFPTREMLRMEGFASTNERISLARRQPPDDTPSLVLSTLERARRGRIRDERSRCKTARDRYARSSCVPERPWARTTRRSGPGAAGAPPFRRTSLATARTRVANSVRDRTISVSNWQMSTSLEVAVEDMARAQRTPRGACRKRAGTRFVKWPTTEETAPPRENRDLSAGDGARRATVGATISAARRRCVETRGLKQPATTLEGRCLCGIHSKIGSVELGVGACRQ
mmetsp:Transcript_40916/g.96458  ORF Transcript_40916/g.96458 Transcript_40916/m.96458 type:complete len:316 (+) Transcript_40916:393-1340(+)